MVPRDSAASTAPHRSTIIRQETQEACIFIKEQDHNGYSLEYLKAAHKHTIFHASEINASSECCCYYCGFQFDPHDPDLEFEFWDTEDLQGREPTITCPMCDIDCVIGGASARDDHLDSG